MKNFKWIVLILGLVALLTPFVPVTFTRDFTSLENLLLQIISLTTGLVGSYIFGRQSAREAAKEVLKPHARNAARHLISLYKSVSRARAAAAIGLPQRVESHENYYIIRGYLIAIFTEQLATADDALENWRDILEEELEDLIQKLQEDNVTPEELEDLIQKRQPDDTTEDRQ